MPPLVYLGKSRDTAAKEPPTMMEGNDGGRKDQPVASA